MIFMDGRGVRCVPVTVFRIIFIGDFISASLFQQVYYKLLCSSIPVAHRVTSSVTTYGYRDPLLPYIVQMLLLFPFPYVFTAIFR